QDFGCGLPLRSRPQSASNCQRANLSVSPRRKSLSVTDEHGDEIKTSFERARALAEPFYRRKPPPKRSLDGPPSNVEVIHHETPSRLFEQARGFQQESVGCPILTSRSVRR